MRLSNLTSLTLVFLIFQSQCGALAQPSFRLKRPVEETSAPAMVPDQTSDPNKNWKPGMILTGSLGETALNPTCDLALAKSQSEQYPESAEAAFIYAVALTRTSQVEVALKEVRRARNLAKSTGDPDYFDRAVREYEDSLTADPENVCVRYGLGWAYYMQAYLCSENARKAQAALAPPPPKVSKNRRNLLAGASILASMVTGEKPPASALPHIPGALEGAPPAVVPQIKSYYARCIAMLQEVVKRDPQDVWAQVYRVHVSEEYDGNLAAALSSLTALKNKYPDNPAAAFFLADAQARSGNFAAGASSLSRAVQLKLEGK